MSEWLKFVLTMLAVFALPGAIYLHGVRYYRDWLWPWTGLMTDDEDGW